MWSSGDSVVVRELHRGRIWKARAWRVVEDRPERLVLWIPRGAPTKMPAGEKGVPREEWTLVDGAFGAQVLRVTRPGEPHSLLHFFADDGRFRGWYVNLERPLERSPVGFDLVDLLLDVWVDPDGSWRWLDEDELDEGLRRGVLTRADADAARAEGERIVAERPWPTGWEAWRPDPGWPVPQLPSGWDVVS
jgi:predicted RNA-binding protein associated with RNAse of E/G family